MALASVTNKAALAIWLGLAATLSGQNLLRLEKSGDAMGSVFSVALYGTDRAAMEASADAALSEARRLDALLSNYKPDSEWSRVNHEAGARPLKISTELFDLLAACLEYSRQSAGAFDITVGPLMRVWGFFRGSGHLPPPAEVSAALDGVGYRHVHLDAAAHMVWFDRRGVEMDPGGIGKGYAVDRMVEILKARGVRIALVAGSGSSIYGLGAPPDEPRGWAADIRDRKDPNKSAAQVFLKDMSLSTSGSYEKFFRAEGRTYAHIMDPRTGYPAQGTASVSVVAPRTIDSEAWAKPFFVNGRQWTAGHKPAGLEVFFCEDTADQACAWVHLTISPPTPGYHGSVGLAIGFWLWAMSSSTSRTHSPNVRPRSAAKDSSRPYASSVSLVSTDRVCNVFAGSIPAPLSPTSLRIVCAVITLMPSMRGWAFPRIECGQPAYLAFSSYLREIGYQSRMSLEATTSDFQTDAPLGLRRSASYTPIRLRANRSRPLMPAC